MMNKNETEDLGGAPESVNSPEAHHSQSTWSGREVLTNSICSEKQGNGNSSGKWRNWPKGLSQASNRARWFQGSGAILQEGEGGHHCLKTQLSFGKFVKLDVFKVFIFKEKWRVK